MVNSVAYGKCLDKKKKFMSRDQCTAFVVSGESEDSCRLVYEITTYLVRDSVYVLLAFISLFFLLKFISVSLCFCVSSVCCRLRIGVV